MPTQQTWVLTNLGAVNFLTMKQIITQQNQQISLLVARMSMLETKLARTTERPALPQSQEAHLWVPRKSPRLRGEIFIYPWIAVILSPQKRTKTRYSQLACEAGVGN